MILELNLCSICFHVKLWKKKIKKKKQQPRGDCGEEGGSCAANPARAPIKFKHVGEMLQTI